MEVCDVSDDFVKLEIGEEEVEAIASEQYGLSGGKIEKLKAFDDLNYRIIPKNTYNPHISISCPNGYILKITNYLDSKNTDLCEAQISLMLFLKENKIPAPIPIKTITGQYYTKIKILPKTYENSNEREHIVRLLQYLPGTVLTDVPLSYPIIFKLGKFSASITYTMKRFSHSAYKTHSTIWHLRNAPLVRKHLEVVENLEKRELLNHILEEFVQRVLLKEDNLEKGTIHGDINENNVLMSQTDGGVWDVSGILDFGDSHFSCCIFDLAIAQCYMMLECQKQQFDPIVGAGHLLAGYIVSRPSVVVDYELLKISICARLCQSLVLGLKAYSLNPENTYVLSSQPNGWAVLELLWHTSITDITRIWNSVIHLYGLNTTD